MKILITSDNHLGYKETDKLRKTDTFNTLEEILTIAKSENVDFIIQGGDFFDENKPSRNTYNQAIQILKKYCLGDEKSSLISNIPLNYHSSNINISLPIFSIHGNHDDPSGFNTVSPLDIIQSSGLINYFGKVDNVDKFTIDPILLETDSKVALYGIGHIKNSRIYKTFKSGNVSFTKPPCDDWYKILVVHQNRTPREDEFLPEDFIDPLFDLVIYGHEHESMKLRHKNFDVIQCGSTVRTSLCEGESHDKYVYILELGNEIHIKRIKLITVRPLILENLRINEGDPEIMIKSKITEMVAKINYLEECSNENNKMLPLLRLRVEILNDKIISKHRILEYLQEVIANPADALKINRKIEKISSRKRTEIKRIEIIDIYKEILKQTDMVTLTAERVIDSLKEFLYKDNKDAFDTMMNKNFQEIFKYVDIDGIMMDNLENEIKNAVKKLKSENEEYQAIEEINQSSETNNEIFDEETKETIAFQNSQGSTLISNFNDAFDLSDRENLMKNDYKKLDSSNQNKEYTFIEEKKENEEIEKVIEKIKHEKEEKNKRLKDSSTEDDFFTFTKYL